MISSRSHFSRTFARLFIAAVVTAMVGCEKRPLESTEPSMTKASVHASAPGLNNTGPGESAEQLAEQFLKSREPFYEAARMAARDGDGERWFAAMNKKLEVEKAALTTAEQTLAANQPRRLAVIDALRAEVVQTAVRLVTEHERHEQWDAAFAIERDQVNLTRDWHGTGHWRNIDARWRLVDTELLRDLSAERRSDAERAALTKAANLLLRVDVANNTVTLNGAEQGLAILETLYPPSQYPRGHTLLARGVSDVGFAFASHGQFIPAHRYHQRALKMLKSVYPPDEYPAGHPELARNLTVLGGGAIWLDDESDTSQIEYYQQALAILDQFYSAEQYPQGHPTLARLLNSLGIATAARRDFVTARDYLERSLAIQKRLYPREQFPQGSKDLVSSLENFGQILKSLGDPNADDYLEQAKAMTETL